MRLVWIAIILTSLAAHAGEVPADAPVQKPVTLLYPDGGACMNAAAVQAADKLLEDARAEQFKPVLIAGAVGLVVGVVVGVVVAPLTKPKP